MSEEKQCFEKHRLERIEDVHETLREDIQDVRAGFVGLTKELHNISGDLKDFSNLAQNILTRLEDRDKAQAEVTADIKDTFKRFGRKIDESEERLRKLEVNVPRLEAIENVMKYFILGIGGLVVFYIQQRIH